MRHEERDALKADIYDLLTDSVDKSIHLVPRQKAIVRDLVVEYIENKYHTKTKLIEDLTSSVRFV